MKRGDNIRVRATPGITGIIVGFTWRGQLFSGGHIILPRIWRVANVLHREDSRFYAGKNVKWAVSMLEKIPSPYEKSSVFRLEEIP